MKLQLFGSFVGKVNKALRLSFVYSMYCSSIFLHQISHAVAKNIHSAVRFNWGPMEFLSTTLSPLPTPHPRQSEFSVRFITHWPNQVSLEFLKAAIHPLVKEYVYLALRHTVQEYTLTTRQHCCPFKGSTPTGRPPAPHSCFRGKSPGNVVAKRDKVKSHKYPFRTDSGKLLKINKRNKAISTTGMFTDINNQLKLKCGQHQTATKKKKKRKIY